MIRGTAKTATDVCSGRTQHNGQDWNDEMQDDL
jgi:hypothetical protein